MAKEKQAGEKQKLTPMMQQYMAVKEQNPDAILFYRLGDFYEMFFEDAKVASRELELTLTGRDCGLPQRAPMCGVPFHSAESYIARLIQKGYKVAICEQMEDPATAKGLVKRDVIRKITSGTLLESTMLDEKRNNFICAIQWDDTYGAGLCFCDISTGQTQAIEMFGKGLAGAVISELARFEPSEAVLSPKAMEQEEVLAFLTKRLSCQIERGEEADFTEEAGRQWMGKHFEDTPQLQEDIQGRPMLIGAVGGLLSYLHQTQKNDLRQINRLEVYTKAQFMGLDPAARRNLELCQVMRSGEKKGSLLWVLDHTRTAMGGRLLRQWLEKPLVNAAQIALRQNAVQALLGDRPRRDGVLEGLRGVFDLERLISRVVYGSANCRDLRSLWQTACAIPQVKENLEGFGGSQYLKELWEEIDCLEDVAGLIDRAISTEPPFSLREGNLLREGFDEKIDQLRDLLKGGKGTLAAIEQRERERTGIPKLKVSYNKVFGYYIEISKSYADKAPEDYTRRQTLTGSERFITPELKELESQMLSAGEQLTALEYQLFCKVRDKVAMQAHRIQRTARAIAQLDALCSFALAAEKNGYVMPEVDYSGVLDIREGRHPVVEKMLEDQLFVPNDTYMDEGDVRVSIITGPNMAGKSTYMRQVALIVVMAQCGSFVPAKSAHVGICDQVFTRVGASDDLTRGQSTFMVEMSEVADILQKATHRSLLILDEIGRGTSTYDGMAIARAVLEYAASKKTLGAKTLFATHYHELSQLESQVSGVKNYNVVVKKRGDDITFLRKIVPGGADDSYGIQVAKLAGLPDLVIQRAKQVLESLLEQAPQQKAECRKKASQPEAPEGQMTLGAAMGEEVLEKLRRLEPDTLSPIEGLGLLYELCKLAKEC